MKIQTCMTKYMKVTKSQIANFKIQTRQCYKVLNVVVRTVVGTNRCGWNRSRLNRYCVGWLLGRISVRRIVKAETLQVQSLWPNLYATFISKFTKTIFKWVHWIKSSQSIFLKHILEYSKFRLVKKFFLSCIVVPSTINIQIKKSGRGKFSGFQNKIQTIQNRF